MDHERHPLYLSYMTAHYTSMRAGKEGPLIPPPLLDATEPVTYPIAYMLFIIILIVLRGGGVGRGGNNIPQLYHDFVQRLAPGGARR